MQPPYPPPAPPRPIGDDPLARALIPVGRSGWAIAAGYFGLVAFFADLVGLLLVFAPLGHPGEVGAVAAIGGLGVVLVAAPALGFGLLGHRAIRRDPSKHGMGRVGFAYVTAGLLVLEFLIGMVRALVA